MKSFYSILRASANAIDSIAIGVIVFNGESFEWYFSNKRIRVAKKLFSSEIDFDFSVKQIERSLKEENSRIENNKNKNNLFDFESNLDYNYFGYLSNYANNTIQIDKPKQLSNHYSKLGFEKFASAFFPEMLSFSIIDPEKIGLAYNTKIIGEKLINRVKDRVHTNLDFGTQELRSRFQLHFNIKVDCIGKNGSFVAAKSLDFGQSVPTVEKHINEYNYLISTLNITQNVEPRGNRIFILADEPQLDSDTHAIWDSVFKNQLLTIINPEESDQVAEVIERQNASKFI